jgi:aminocyclitol acetyltransferase
MAANEIFGKHLNCREIAIWGIGEYLHKLLPLLAENKIEISFFVDRKYENIQEFAGKRVRGKGTLNKDKHFVIIASNAYANEIALELQGMGFCDYDYLLGSDLTALLRRFVFDRTFWSVSIGKFSYCSKKQLHISGKVSTTVESIGRFSSINDTAEIWSDHSRMWISTGSIAEWIPEGILKTAPPAHCYRNPTHRITIGNDVWIGHNAFVNSGKCAKIGDGAIIGAGAVVLEDVPPYAIVAGVPGKVKKYRYSPQEIECLLRIKWWDFTDAERDKYAACLFNPEEFFREFM